MEAQWQANRALLRRIMQPQPQWTQRDYAESIGRSIAWVKKWISASAPHYPTISPCCAVNHPCASICRPSCTKSSLTGCSRFDPHHRRRSIAFLAPKRFVTT